MCSGGTGYSRHRWSGPGGPFIPNTDGPGRPLIGGTVSSMTGLLYCPEILPNHVFTNPQVLLDKISELVKIHHDLMSCSGPEQRTEEWQMLFDHTLVTLEFLSQEVFEKRYVKCYIQPKDLVILF